MMSLSWQIFTPCSPPPCIFYENGPNLQFVTSLSPYLTASYMDEPYSCGRNVSSSKDSGANMNHRAQPNQRWPCGKKCDFSHNCIFNAGSRSKLDSRTPCCTAPYLDSIKFPMKHSCSLIIIGLVINFILNEWRIRVTGGPYSEDRIQGWPNNRSHEFGVCLFPFIFILFLGK